MVITYVLYKSLLTFPPAPSHIRDTASRDLSICGKYNDATAISVKYWIYSILVSAYAPAETTACNALIGKYSKVSKCIYDWVYEDVIDPDTILLDAVSLARYMLDNEVQKAAEEKRDPVFTVSPEYDYHVVPKSLLYNEYVNYNKLLCRLQSLEEQVE